MKLLLLLVFTFLSYSQKADDILGFWLTNDEQAIVEIKKVDNKYFGNLFKVKPEGEKEFRLPPKKAENKLILRNFMFDEDEWVDGEVFAKRFNEFKSVILEMDDKDHLIIAVSLFLFKKRITWTRVK